MLKSALTKDTCTSNYWLVQRPIIGFQKCVNQEEKNI